MRLEKAPPYTFYKMDALVTESLTLLFRWFKTARDPENRGLVATLHPWESGMDNSPMWDEALMAVPVDAIPPYTRKDLGHVDSAMRPKQAVSGC
jgi:hypothetical protein